MTTWRGALKARAAGLADGRVYWDERPQTSGLPALVINVIGDGRPQHLKGFDLSPSRIQFDAYGATPEVAWDVIDSTIDSLVPGGVFNGHIFSRADVALGPRDIVE